MNDYFVLPHQIEKHEFLGIVVHEATLPRLNDIIRRTVSEKGRLIVANHNLHSLYLVHHDRRMQTFYKQSACIHADGMGIIALGRLMGHALSRAHRVTYADWMLPLMREAAESGWRVFYLGSKPGVAEMGARFLRTQFPSLAIMTSSGYFDGNPDSLDNGNIVQRIEEFGPQLLMVGMGMPRQEHWVASNLEQISANVIFTCGAAMDYVAGVVPTSPRWIGRIGLEWLFRLSAEPRRLWGRYLLEPWYVAGLVAKSYLAIFRVKQQSTP